VCRELGQEPQVVEALQRAAQPPVVDDSTGLIIVEVWMASELTERKFIDPKLLGGTRDGEIRERRLGEIFDFQ
jgi:hypothetical protein